MKAGWQDLASDQLTPNPNFFLRTMFYSSNGVKNPILFLRTMFSQLKRCEKPEFFSSDPFVRSITSMHALTPVSR
jgi:hypothetical protein